MKNASTDEEMAMNMYYLHVLVARNKYIGITDVQIVSCH